MNKEYISKDPTLIQDIVRIENIYNGQDYTPPDGYQIADIIPTWEGNNGFITSRLQVVLVKNILFADKVKELEEKLEKEKDFFKKSEEERCDRQIAKSTSLVAFSDLITRFKLGDKVYYFEFASYANDIDNIECHIRHVVIDSIYYTNHYINIIDKERDSDGNKKTLTIYDYYFNTISMNNLNPLITLYKDRTECIEVNRVLHREKIETYRKDQEKLRIEKELHDLERAKQILAKHEGKGS